MEKANWEKITTPVIASDRPQMMGVNALRGGEDYNSNIDRKIAPGQNSITNPKAIESFASSDIEDTGKRLSREKQERENAKKEDVKMWQKNIVDSMTHKDKMAKSVIRPTFVDGVINNTRTMENNTPEQTQGEKLKEYNVERKSSISRERDVAKREINISQNNLMISDSFHSSLQKHLNKGK